MGFELEVAARDNHEQHEQQQCLQRLVELERRWESACKALTAAQCKFQALADRQASATELATARARVIAARRARLRLAEDMERLEAEASLHDIWI
jgi:hypothetical protein